MNSGSDKSSFNRGRAVLIVALLLGLVATAVYWLLPAREPTARLSVEPAFVLAGGTVEVTWETQHASEVRIEPPGRVVEPGGQFEGPVRDDTRFELIAVGSDGVEVRQVAEVRVAYPIETENLVWLDTPSYVRLGIVNVGDMRRAWRTALREANELCAGLNQDAFAGWRVPSQAELEELHEWLLNSDSEHDFGEVYVATDDEDRFWFYDFDTGLAAEDQIPNYDDPQELAADELSGRNPPLREGANVLCVRNFAQ